MENPQIFYSKRLKEFSEQVSQLKQRFFLYSMTRLAVFLLTAACIYFFRQYTPVLVSVIAAGIVGFIFLVGRSADIKRKQRYYEQLVHIQETELAGLSGDFSSFDHGGDFLSGEHPYNQDIDLFGEGSLFQRVNRTETKGGRAELGQWLNSNDTEKISEKQATVKELASKADWRQRFKATASLIETSVPSEHVLRWFDKYQPFVPQLFGWLPFVIGLGTIGLLVAFSLGMIPGIYLLYWLFVGLTITGPFVKRITRLYADASTMKDTLAQYAEMLKAIENETFETPALQQWQQKIRTEGENASVLLRNLARQIDYLGNRNNMLFAPVANGFFLWDLYFALRIERWLKHFDSSVHQWFETIEYFDAANSMANYSFNHPMYIYPELSKDPKVILDAKGIGHPLINPERSVRNDVHINHAEFFIITGANMAGKSTFLRTVSLNLVMANCGLPVDARHFEFSPVKLISSMRTSDSLQNDESYFFSELKRLKFIVDTLESGNYFIVLDEILKGTNSKDKAEGSQKFVERLLKTGSTGLIATHDLSLCSLADEFPQVANYYFDAEIVNDELHFDYTFKKGICRNMNASFLLKKMNIV